MATKKEILDRLAELGVEIDPNLPKNELENKLAEAESAQPKEEARKPADMAEGAKNFAEKKAPQARTGMVDPTVGIREVTVTGPDQEIKVIKDKDELMKLQEAGQLVHYDSVTGQAAIRKKPQLNREGKPVYEGKILVDRRI